MSIDLLERNDIVFNRYHTPHAVIRRAMMDYDLDHAILNAEATIHNETELLEHADEVVGYNNEIENISKDEFVLGGQGEVIEAELM